jgi:hypothetical protein
MMAFNSLKMINKYYVTEGPFLHLTVCCRFLIGCVGGGGGGNRVVTLAVVYDLVFRVIKYGPWISQASVT